VITVLRLGEVMPSEANAYPNPLALTHLLLSAIHRLGVWPDATIRSDYTPVDYVAARVVAAVRDRHAWGRTLHIFHPESVCLPRRFPWPARRWPGPPAATFLARLHEASREPGEREFARLAALLPAPTAWTRPRCGTLQRSADRQPGAVSARTNAAGSSGGGGWPTASFMARSPPTAATWARAYDQTGRS